MKSKLIKIIAIAIISLFGLIILNSSPVFAADNNNDICSMEERDFAPSVWEAAGCNGGDENELPNTIVNILNAVIAVCGLVAVIYVIVGGVQYMTSSGDASKTKQAKSTILYAIIGLIICALSFAIVNFVISDILKQKTSSKQSFNSSQIQQTTIAFLEK